MEQHKRVLGIIYIVTAALQMLGLVLVSLLASTIMAFIKNEVAEDEARIVDFVFSILRILPWVVIIFMSIPSIIAGLGLVNGQKWALTLALILGCFKLFAFPIGTAIGVYTIWVYAEANKLEKEQIK